MATKELKLLKRYKYDKNENYDVYEERRAWSSKTTVLAVDAYDYGGTPYIVSTYWYCSGSSDREVSDYYRDLTFKIYPIDIADVDDEQKVMSIAETKGFKKQVDRAPHLDTRSEENFTESIKYYLIGAMHSYLLDEKKREAEACGKKIEPNVVMIRDMRSPETEIVEDFETQEGLGVVFYRCSRVRIAELDEDSQKALGIERPLCYYSPEGEGRPTIFFERSYYDNRPTISFRHANRWETIDKVALCAYEDLKPAPLTPNEVQKILDYTN